MAFEPRGKTGGKHVAIRRFAIKVVAGLLISWGVVAAVMYLQQDALTFHPHSIVERTPADVGMDYEDVRIVAGDGETLAGWWIPAPGSRGALLYLHGNAGNIGHRVRHIELLHSLRLDIFIFDYRGFGDSTGEPSEQGLYGDARAAWEYLVQQRAIDGSRITIYGRSLGGSVAAHLASRVDAGALVLEATFASLPDLAWELYPGLAWAPLVRYEFPTIEFARDITEPALVLHGEGDDLVGLHHARRIVAALPSAQLETLQGGHDDAPFVAGVHYLETLETFLSRALERDDPKRGESEAPASL